jgi:lysylphosphatidylglycerol synthetase-like protein (DUF2156 family)
LTTQSDASGAGQASRVSTFIQVSGAILALSYPLLALSTGVRSLYQLLWKEGVTDYFGPAMSGVAALCYLLAAIGFAVRRRWAWWLSVWVLGIETLLTLLIGTLSLIYPELIGGTVWRAYGADYGYFPLVQPLIGLAWLLWPETRRAYGILAGDASGQGRA